MVNGGSSGPRRANMNLIAITGFSAYRQLGGEEVRNAEDATDRTNGDLIQPIRLLGSRPDIVGEALFGAIAHAEMVFVPSRISRNEDMMPTITGTNGNDHLVGTEDSDTINSLLGKDTVDGLGGEDTLIVDYHSASIDPYAGASIADVHSIVSSNGGSFSGVVSTVDGGNFVTFANIEHLQVKLDFWQNTFTLDGSAIALGATVMLDGGLGTDTLDANLSALASVALQYDAGGTTASFGTIISFEAFQLNLTEGADHVTTGAGKDRLTGNGGDDVLSSGGGDDFLSGGSGSNILNAGDGDDQIISAGIDTVDGGSGYDRWTGDYGASTANFSLTRDRAAGTATLSNGTSLSGIEQIVVLTTGSGNDTITLTSE